MSDGDGGEDFERLLEHIHRNRGFDFSGYKRSSLMRRVDKRMQMVGVAGYTNYVDFLEVHPEEFAQLFNTILINVTAFFRDPSSWDALVALLVPKVVTRKGEDEPIRVWSAGCASGEEAFTLAMIMAESLGLDHYRERVKIYATDIDEEALRHARHAAYDAREVEAVPPALREKYFELTHNRYVFHKDLRRSVIFGRHDLIQDAPISRIDLLTCRNTLMYLNAETQARILERFHFALNEHGFLFLGKAETLLTYNDTFVAIDLKRRIFSKVARGELRERLMVLSRGGFDEDANHMGSDSRVREAAFNGSPVAQMAVDFGGQLAMANDQARSLFGLVPDDIGRPFHDLQVSYRPVDLRSCIDRAYADRRPIVLKDVEWTLKTPGEPSYLEIHVLPLVDAVGTLLGAGLTFLDNTAARRLGEELQKSNKELETAYEELQSTNEELETTNEELQSTNEELETTNEELQSTNEELETMNEELQSTNEELETVNEELRERSLELNQLNGFLESILGSLRGGVAVVDSELLVQVWNQKCEDLWGLRLDEVRGKNLLNLDIGLPVERLKPLLKACLAGETTYQDIMLDAVNRRGKPLECRVSCRPMPGVAGIAGVILIMDDEGSRPQSANREVAPIFDGSPTSEREARPS